MPPFSSASSPCSSPARRYYLLGGAARGLVKAKEAQETRLMRCLGLCTAGLLLLDIWAWMAPGVLAEEGTEHTLADFDASSLLYLFPLTLHALAALTFFTRKPHPPLPFWTHAIRLRVAATVCLGLGVPALVARVVSLHQFCRLEGKVAEVDRDPHAEEEDDGGAFKACASGALAANAAAMAVAYAVLGVLMVQALTELEALARWQQQLLLTQRQHLRAAASAANSYDGHTPPSGCTAGGGGGGGTCGDSSGFGYLPPFPIPFAPADEGHGQQPLGHGGGGGGSSAATSLASSFGERAAGGEDAAERLFYYGGRMMMAAPDEEQGAVGAGYRRHLQRHHSGVSAAAAATAHTLYGDALYQDISPSPSPPPTLPVVTTAAAAAAAAASGEEEEQQEEASASPPGNALTLSSGGPQSSAFSSYVAATTHA